MRLTVQRGSDVPIYRQIVNQVREQVLSGALPAGSRLPPVRQLAAEHGLTRLTVHSAYSELQALGLVEPHVGRGTFVAAGAVRVSEIGGEVRPPTPWISQGILAELLGMGDDSNLLSFAQAFPASETYPARELGRALQQALREPSALGYGPIQGDPALRDQIASLLLDRGLSAPPEHVLVTAGAQQGIDLVTRALTKPGDVILVEEPVYPGVLELAALREQRVIGVPNHGGELDIDALEAACSTHRPRLLYLVPTYSNPTGKTLQPGSRAAVLRAAQARDLLVLEDDTYGLLGLEGPAPPALKRDDLDERVVYITSFSKMLAPGLRLGALVAPVAQLPALAAAKQSSDLVCSTVMQRALAGYLRQGHLAAHLTSVRPLYSERREAMLSALQRHLAACNWTYPDGGLSLWVDLPESIEEADFAADALRQGVGIAPGSAFFPYPRRRASMRLSFGAHSPEAIERGIAILGRVLESHLQRRHRMLSLARAAAAPLV